MNKNNEFVDVELDKRDLVCETCPLIELCQYDTSLCEGGFYKGCGYYRARVLEKIIGGLENDAK